MHMALYVLNNGRDKKYLFCLQVKVTEIFDVTDSDSPFVQTSHERETNMQLQFDEDGWMAGDAPWSSDKAVIAQCGKFPYFVI